MQEHHSDSSLSFWDHVEQLRTVILRSLAVILLLSILAAAIMPQLFDSCILAPCRPDFPTYALPGMALHGTITLINLELTSQFLIHMSASLWLGFIVALPVVLILFWNFFEPALYPSERRTARAALISGTLLFYIGAATGYMLVFPLSLRFLSSYQLSTLIPNHISLTSYIDCFATILLGMGLLFEMPLIAWALGKIGIIDRKFFSRYRRHAIVALLILAAIITPTTDPFTLFAVFIPVYLLWELGALLVPRNRSARNDCANDKHAAPGQQPDAG